MSKYLKLFETVADYTAAENTLVKPNVSLIEETNNVEYNPYIPVCTITYIGDGASPTKILLKYLNAFGSNYTLEESSILKMTLDDNIVSFNDFTLTNLTPYGALMDVYTYTFDDENEHTLKIWTKSTNTFRFGVWYVGPSGYDYAFSSIKDIVIPNGVTTIGDGAFSCCSGLTSITIPDSVTSISKYAFYDCSSLTSITIPNSVTSIGTSAFSGCTKLTSITIPNSVTTIGGGAFYNCSNLAMIDVESGNVKYDSRDNCNAIIETATNTLITGCQNTTIPNSVTTIGEDAFSNCSSLTSITIPNSVTSIGMYAFEGCSSLISVTVEATTPPTLEYRYGEDGQFDNNASGRKIYVPAESVDTYKSASGWSDYASDIEAIQTA